MHSAILLTLFLQYGRTINKKEIRNYLANQPSHVQVSSMHIAICIRAKNYQYMQVKDSLYTLHKSKTRGAWEQTEMEGVLRKLLSRWHAEGGFGCRIRRHWQYSPRGDGRIERHRGAPEEHRRREERKRHNPKLGDTCKTEGAD